MHCDVDISHPTLELRWGVTVPQQEAGSGARQSSIVELPDPGSHYPHRTNGLQAYAHPADQGNPISTYRVLRTAPSRS